MAFEGTGRTIADHPSRRSTIQEIEMTDAPEPVENDTIGSLFAGIERIVRDAESDRDRWSHIAATIRVNALYHGATDAEVDAMIRGEKNFISFIADIVDARSKPRAPFAKEKEPKA